MTEPDHPLYQLELFIPSIRLIWFFTTWSYMPRSSFFVLKHGRMSNYRIASLSLSPSFLLIFIPSFLPSVQSVPFLLWYLTSSLSPVIHYSLEGRSRRAIEIRFWKKTFVHDRSMFPGTFSPCENYRNSKRSQFYPFFGSQPCSTLCSFDVGKTSYRITHSFIRRSFLKLFVIKSL